MTPIVMVTWHDAAGIQGWRDADEAAHYNPYIVKSVGYLILKNKDVVILGMSETEDRDQFADRLVVPRGMVKSIKKL